LAKMNMTSETTEERAEIAVIGLGNAGLPLAAVIADSGINVVGIDVNRERCRLINEGRNPIPEERGLGELIEKYGGRQLCHRKLRGRSLLHDIHSDRACFCG